MIEGRLFAKVTRVVGRWPKTIRLPVYLEPRYNIEK